MAGHWPGAQIPSPILVSALTGRGLRAIHFQVPHQEDGAARGVSENSKDVCETLTAPHVLTAALYTIGKRWKQLSATH